jgi:hypothetical protein
MALGMGGTGNNVAMIKISFTINALLIVLFVLVAAVFLELSMRAAPSLLNAYPITRNYMPNIFRPDVNITWTVRANASSLHQHIAGDFSVTVHTDEKGFRKGRSMSLGKNSILVLGDSFTFGFGVEDNQTYPYYLSEKLPDYNIINAGLTSGMSFDTEYVYLREHFKEIKPSLVIVQVYPGNDFSDIKSNEWIPENFDVPERVVTSFDVDSDGNLYTRRAIPLFKAGLFLQRHSYLFNFLWRRRHSLEKFAMRNDLVDATTLQRAEIIVKALSNFSAENNVPIVVVIIPITKDEQQRLMLEGTVHKFEEMLQKNNMPYTYLDSLFNYPAEQIHFKHDGHYNSFGNEIVADGISEYLRDSSLIESKKMKNK